MTSRTIFLVALSVLVAPFTFALTCFFLVSSRLFGTALYFRNCPPASRRTILITGARATKCLTLLRAFKEKGHRVVLAEESAWGSLSCSRFSRATDAYYPLNDPHSAHEDGKPEYIRRLKDIVVNEQVDLWVPCSTAASTVEDAEAALEMISARPGNHPTANRPLFAAFIQHPNLVASLHWKDSFMDLCHELGLPIPNSQVITSAEEGIRFLHSATVRESGHSYILKAIALNDAVRSDLTLLPRKTVEDTRAQFCNLSVLPSRDYPYVLQRFIRGPEYCTHAAVYRGQVLSFVACRSNDMLMRYVDLNSCLGNHAKKYGGNPVFMEEHERWVAKNAEDWTREFLRRWSELLHKQGKRGKEAELTGHFSFDFILEQSEGILYPIECNPRVHTAVTLFSGHPLLADIYNIYAITEVVERTVIRPTENPMPRSWLVHSLPLSLSTWFPGHISKSILRSLLLLPWLSASVASVKAGKDPLASVTMSPPPGQDPFSLLSSYFFGFEKDAVFDPSDPLPFFVFAHIQWPWFILRELWYGRRWNRVNVSTSRIWAC